MKKSRKKMPRRIKEDPSIAPPFTQITAGAASVFGLDAQGRVWRRELGYSCGWELVGNSVLLGSGR